MIPRSQFEASYLDLFMSVATGHARYQEQNVMIQAPYQYSTQLRARLLAQVINKAGKPIIMEDLAKQLDAEHGSIRAQMPLLRRSLSQLELANGITGNSLILSDQIRVQKKNGTRGAFIKLNVELLQALHEGRDLSNVRTEPFARRTIEAEELGL